MTHPVRTPLAQRGVMLLEIDQLRRRAHNRTPAGLPLDEWNKIQNAKKRERRQRQKGKR